jgi:hypothetical protein
MLNSTMPLMAKISNSFVEAARHVTTYSGFWVFLDSTIVFYQTASISAAKINTHSNNMTICYGRIPHRILSYSGQTRETNFAFIPMVENLIIIILDVCMKCQYGLCTFKRRGKKNLVLWCYHNRSCYRTVRNKHDLDLFRWGPQRSRRMIHDVTFL